MEIPASQRTNRQKALVSLRKKYDKNGFDKHLNHLQRDMEKVKAEAKHLKSQKPMWGSPKPELAHAIAMTNRRLEELDQANKALVLERDTALTQIRALTPVFSKMAFEETRELFKKRQEEYAGVFCWFWKWDMMWSMMFMPMGGRDGGFGEQIARAILDLMYKLTMGTIMALADFGIRLPFWLKEYQIFTYDEIPEDFPNEDISRDNEKSEENMESDDDAYERLHQKYNSEKSKNEMDFDDEDLEDDIDLDKHEYPVQSARSSRGKKFDDFETVSVVGSSGGWMATLSGFVFWCMSMCAASGATIGLILLIWSPIIGLVIYAAITKHHNMNLGGSRRNYHNYGHR